MKKFTLFISRFFIAILCYSLLTSFNWPVSYKNSSSGLAVKEFEKNTYTNADIKYFPLLEEAYKKVPQFKAPWALLASSRCFNDIINFNGEHSVWPFDNNTDDENSGNNAISSSGIRFEDDIAEDRSFVEFDGTDGTGGIQYADSDNGFMTDRFDALSIGFWMLSEVSTSNQVLFEEGDESNGVIIILNAVNEIEIRLKGNGDEHPEITVPFPKDREWHHVALTYEEGGLAIVYIDGIVKNTTLTKLEIREHRDAGGFGNAFGENVMASITLSGYTGKMDEAFYSTETISGGDLFRYVMCFGEPLSSVPLNTGDAFQSTGGDWSVINFAEQTSVPLINKDGEQVILNAGGLNISNNLAFSMKKANIPSQTTDPFTEGNFLVITQFDFDREDSGKYSFKNYVVGPVIGLRDDLNYIAGDVFKDHLYVKNTKRNNASPRDQIYVINIDINSDKFLTVKETITLDSGIDVSDFVINQDGFLYSVANALGNREDKTLYKLNLNLPTGQTVNVESLTKLEYPDGPVSGVPNTFGAQFLDTNNFFYGINNNDGAVYRVNLNLPNDQLKAVFFAQSEPGRNNDGLGSNIEILLDFGDAPDVYGTSLEEAGARHYVDFDPITNQPLLMLGESVDLDTNGFPGEKADGDDLDGDDEDAFPGNQVSFELFGSNFIETPEFSFTNNTGNKVTTIYGWVDFDKNDIFETNDEYTVVLEDSESGTSTLEWELDNDDIKNINKDIPTFMRIRITTDEEIEISPEDNKRDNRSIGQFSDGEVEDYQVTFTCGGEDIPAPALTAEEINECGDPDTTTVNLNDITATNISDVINVGDTPDVGDGPRVILTWHTRKENLTADTLVEDPENVKQGTYFAAFYDTVLDCYTIRTAQVTVTVSSLTPPETTVTQPDCITQTGTIEVTNVQDGFIYTINIVGESDPVQEPQTGVGINNILFTGLPTGQYQVNVQNTEGCNEVSGTVPIEDAPGTPTKPQVNDTQPDCKNPTGTITITNVQDGFIYTINIVGESDPVQEPQTGVGINNILFTGLPTGQYQVNVQNTEGCNEVSGTVQIEDAPGTPTKPQVNDTQPDCKNPTGTITVTNVQDGFIYTINIVGESDPVQEPQTGVGINNILFTGLPTGQYQVNVQNTEGCNEVSGTVQIEDAPGTPTKPLVNDTQPDCKNPTGTITVTNVQDGFIYTINIVGESDPVQEPQTGVGINNILFTGLPTGQYQVNVQNTEGCNEVSGTVQIEDAPGTPTKPQVNDTQPDCKNPTGTITVTNVQDGFIYTIEQVDVSPPVTIGEPQTGVGINNILFTGLPTGQYQVNVQNTEGCNEVSGTVQIEDAPGTPTKPQVNDTQPDCENPTGTITVTNVQDGFIYTINIVGESDPVQEPQTGVGINNILFTGLPTGQYQVNVQNTEGCNEVSGTVQIEDAPGTPTQPQVNDTQPDCKNPTGTITVTNVQDGFIYTINIVGESDPVQEPQTGVGINDISFTGLLTGQYQVNVQNTEGCNEVSGTVPIEDAPGTPTKPQVNDTQPDCKNPTGTITVTNVQDGFIYTINIVGESDPVQEPQTGVGINNILFTGLPTGQYQVNVQNTEGCNEVSGTVPIEDAPGTPTKPQVNDTQPDCKNPTGTITVTNVQDGFIYTINIVGESDPVQEPQTGVGINNILFTGLPTGQYQVNVQNTEGCNEVSGTVQIEDAPGTPTKPQVNDTQPDCKNPTGTITVTNVQDGFIYTINIVGESDPVQEPQTGVGINNILFTGLPTGQYQVNVQNTEGCNEVSGTVQIEDAPGTPTQPQVNDTQPDCKNPTGTITVTNVQDGFIYTINIVGESDPVQEPQTGVGINNILFTGLPTGQYQVNVQNTEGCNEVSGTVQIEDAPGTPTQPQVNDTQPDCKNPTGTITVTNVQDGFIYTINIVGESDPVQEPQTGVGINDISFTGLLTGQYQVNVQNTEGCNEVSGTVQIEDAPGTPTKPQVNDTQPDCKNPTGTITVTNVQDGFIYTINIVGESDPVQEPQTGVGINNILFTGLPTGQYQVNVQNTEGCNEVSGTVPIEDAPGTPTQPQVNDTQPDCKNPTGTITITNVQDGFIYTINIVGESDPVQEPQTGVGINNILFTGLPTGQYQVNVQNTEGCNEVSGTVQIEDAPGTPTKPLVNDTQPDCKNPTGTITVTNVQDGFIYTINIVGESDPVQEPQTGVGINNILFTGLPTGQYQVNVQNTEGCNEVSGTVQIEDAPGTPTKPQVNDTQPDCKNPTGTITVTNVQDGFIYTINIVGESDPVQEPQTGVGINNILFTGLPTGQYQVNVQNTEGCNEVSGTVQIEDAPGTPTKPLVNDTQPDCKNPTGTITVTNVQDGFIYTINIVGESDPVQEPQTGVGINNILFTGLPTGQYQVNVQNTEGCNEVSGTVQIEDAPGTPTKPQVNDTQPDCKNPTGTITVTNVQDGFIYTIEQVDVSPPVTIGEPQTGVGINNILFTGLPKGQYQVNVQNTEGCNEVSGTVQIEDAPGTPTKPQVNDTQPDCENPTGTITVTNVQDGFIYTIEQVDVSPPVTIGEPQTGVGINDIIFTGLPKGQYQVNVQQPEACNEVSRTVQIEEVPGTPTKPQVNDTQPDCENPTGTITVTNVQAGFTYTIKRVGESDPVQDSQTGGSTGNIVFTDLSTGQYQVNVQNTEGCNTISKTVVIQETPAPAKPETTVIQPDCVTQTGAIEIITDSKLIYSLTGGRYLVETSLNKIRYRELIPGMYQLVAKNVNNCSSEALSIEIETPPSTPAVPLLTLTSPTCAVGGNIKVINTIPGLIYILSDGSGEVIEEQTSEINQDLVFEGLPIGTYNLGVDNGSCTTMAENISLNLETTIEEPTVETISANSCLDSNAEIRVTSPLGPQYEYSLNEKAFQTSPIFTNVIPGTYVVTVRDTNTSCSAISTTSIEAPPITMFNAVSPNNNSMNEIFRLEGIECYPDNNVKIFNRWGVLVYETNNYDNQNNAFKGISMGRVTIDQNEKLPTGNYFYIVTYRVNHNTSERVNEQSGHLYISN